MKKMLKIMAMLLVIATVVFAAGCSDKADTTAEDGAQEEVTDQTPVADENLSGSEAPAEGAPTEDIAADDDSPAGDVEVVENDSNVTDSNATDSDVTDLSLNVTDGNSTEDENESDI